MRRGYEELLFRRISKAARIAPPSKKEGMYTVAGSRIQKV